MEMAWGRIGVAILTIFVITALMHPCFYPTAKAETKITFTSKDVFTSPDTNSTIRFATNGSCSQVTLAGGVWSFVGLTLNNSRNVANITLSAKDCNLTVFSVAASNFSARSVSVRYNVAGEGSQSVRFPDIKGQTRAFEWSIIVPGDSGNLVWLSEGQNWNLLPNNTVVVYGVRGNVTVSRFNVGFVSDNSNLPFAAQHSVAIITASVLVAVVAVALVVKVVERRR